MPADERKECKALSEREKAELYDFLKAIDSVGLRMIAWRYESASRFHEPDEAIKAARDAHMRGELPHATSWTFDALLPRFSGPARGRG